MDESTTFDINNQQLVVEYTASSAAEAPKLTTFDLHNQHQTVEYGDPALLPKRRTTHDAAVERLTQEYQPVEFGNSSPGSVSYRFNGE